METATITSKGQTTVPRKVREHLGLKPGDRIRFFIHPDGSVAIRAVVPVTRLKGLLQRSGKALTVEEMNAAIAEHVSQRNKP